MGAVLISFSGKRLTHYRLCPCPPLAVGRRTRRGRWREHLHDHLTFIPGTHFMSLPTTNTLFAKDAFDTDFANVPRIVKRLVFENGLNLYGSEGLLLESFRFQQLLSDTQKKQALFNKTRLSKEGLACLLFDVLNQILRKLNFKYSYGQNHSVFSDGGASENMELSCMGCTGSFAGLLYNFGFEPGTMYAHVSNPTNNDALKVSMKQTLSPDAVKGFRGSNPDVAYNADAMAPTHDELSNGFKLQTLLSGGHAVKMVPRDPFLNHYTLFVDAGFAFPYFDPLIGARYKGGQGDAFNGYQRWHTGGFTYNHETVEVFKHTENDQLRLYSVPGGIDFATNPDFAKAKIKYLPEGLKIWILIDTDDWMQNTATTTRHRSGNAPAPALAAQVPRVNSVVQMGGHRTPAQVGGHRAAPARQSTVAHPPNITQLYGLA